MTDVNVNFPPSPSPVRGVTAKDLEMALIQIKADVEGQVSEVSTKLVDTQITNFIKAKNSNGEQRRTTYFLYDSFERVDSTSSIGNAETNDLPYTILTTGGGVWGIQNKMAYLASTGGVGRHLAIQETYESDVIVEADLKAIGSGLCFRVSDLNNFLFCTVSPTYIVLSKRVEGVYTLIKDVSPTAAYVKTMTDDSKLTILMKGNKIEVYIDGFFIFKAYDNFNSTETKHGLFSTGEILATRWDKFNVRTLGSIPYNIKEGFENDLSSWYWYKETAGLPHSQTFNSDIKKTGNKSLRIELKKDDPEVANSKRCEIMLRSEEPLEEHWYGVSIFLPNSENEDFKYDDEHEILMQWHTSPDVGEENVSPPLSLTTYKGRYIIAQNTDEGRFSKQFNPYTLKSFNTDIGEYENDKGKWVDWVFHVKWGWLADQNPILEVYKNGVLVCERNGMPNCMNDKKGVYLKLGIYKWSWKGVSNSIVNNRVVYYDDFFMR